jgi:hypothetical protein
MIAVAVIVGKQFDEFVNVLAGAACRAFLKMRCTGFASPVELWTITTVLLRHAYCSARTSAV